MFPPPAAHDPLYAETSYDTTGTWYGYGGVTAEQSGAWPAAQEWQQHQYQAAYGQSYDYAAGTAFAPDPTATVSWGTAAFTSPDATGQYTVQDLYAATGYGDYTADQGYQQYAGYDQAPVPGAGYYANGSAQAQQPQDEAQPYDEAQQYQDAQPYDEMPAEAPAEADAEQGDLPYEAYDSYEYDSYEYPYEGDHAEGEASDTAEPLDDAEQPVQADDDRPDTAFAAAPASGRAAARAASRGRPRTARRSALLTIAVPSVAVMGVAAAAAVTVSVPDQGSTHETAAGSPDATASPKTAATASKLDTQLAGLRKDADDFAGRVSRNQARLDLKARQAAEKARKEALRPKFVLPVTERGLSATFGMAGTHWAALHTGIDFPVSWGTSVHSATDGTVRTQWNSAYGYMAIVTASDGSETWYCHLSSYKIRSGKVKAGDTIAYSGSSGNSTGPHLHFEVHPGGEGTPAVDPIPWLLSHGLDPR
ncbi:M23 family metallopeptidase [Peterkaempfera sp. SMS 1(5)a]|uniref:M23 family metallopeptidase n=1 Tax=Peterkaempfera podocarpi TaxID=3232308 RepID=UPI00366DE242